MKRRCCIVWIGIILAGLVRGIFFPCESALRAAPAGDVVVICNKSVPDEHLSRKDIRDIYLGQKIQWSDNSKIIFVTLNVPEIHEAFLNDYVGKTDFQYTSYWRKLLYTGRGTLPKSFENEEKLLEYVANTQGAVGYVSASAAGKGNVKTIAVE